MRHPLDASLLPPLIQVIFPPQSLLDLAMHSIAQVSTGQTVGGAIVTVHRLPNEMLAQIFKEYMLKLLHDKQVDPGQSSLSRTPPSLATITYVCQKWRYAAVTNPSLWILEPVPVHIPSWTKEVLARSVTMPLVVRAVHAQLPSLSISYIFQHIHRVESLKINLDPRRTTTHEIAMWKRVLILLEAAKPAPLLKTLHIWGRLHHDTDSPDFLPIVIPDTIFKGVFPQMTNLAAAYVSISSLSPLFQANLTSLILESVTVWETYAEMSVTLRLTLCLEYLRIGMSMPRPSTLTPHDFVVLPNLQTLAVYGPISQL
ncbi:hypothetical protein OF83DRAFT_1179986, partial [Amylostereum chailletii]